MNKGPFAKVPEVTRDLWIPREWIGIALVGAGVLVPGFRR